MATPSTDGPALRHNGAPVSRERFYAIACDPRRHVAVQACAGAGKTWMLVSRIVRALLEFEPDAFRPHEILAITFTKKAAGEMRERLDQWLERFATLSLPELARELRARGMDATAAEAAAPRLKGLYRQTLEAGRPVQIRTFHGWFASLLGHAPIALLRELGLPAAYQLLEDDGPARRKVWRPFYAALLADPALGADYRALVADHGRSQTGKALDEALTRRVEFSLADRGGDVGDHVLPFGRQYPDMAGFAAPARWLLEEPAQRELLTVAARALGGANAPSFSQKGVELEAALESGDANGVQGALLTQAGEPRKFSAKVVGLEQVRTAQEIVVRCCAASAQHAAWLYQQRMTRLSRKLVAVFSDLKRQHGWVDMNDVEAAAHRMLSDPILSGWLAERLDARIRHLLIDEFQDTNPMQWQALCGWLSGYAGSGGGQAGPGVFIVGDPKQSIYRFRRAEPQVFVAAERFIAEALGGDLLSGDHTHRNAHAVLALVNSAMAAAQQAGEIEGFRKHTTESLATGDVLALPLIERVDSEIGPEPDSGPPLWRDSLATPRVLAEERASTHECRQAAQWLANAIAQGVAPADIMVLSRRRARFGVMQDELRALHIAVQQPEKNDLHDAPEVQDLVALLDVLVSPGHDLSMARALRSPLFNFGDDALVELALLQRERNAPTAAITGGVADARATWFSLLVEADMPEQLASAGASAGASLARWKQWVDALPPHDALAAIYEDGDVLARFAQVAPAALRSSVLANLRALLAASLAVDNARFATPYALVRTLRAGGVQAPALAPTDAVRLLTVHGAKGLEAELVLLLDCDAAPPRAQTMGTLVVWPGERPVPTRFVFLASERSPSACVVADLAFERGARQREEVNALYVATTRARSRLVLSGVRASRSDPDAPSWWDRLAEHAAQVDLSDTPTALTVPTESEPFFILNWALNHTGRAQTAIKNIANEQRMESRAPDTAATAFGQAMHRLLEWTGHGKAIDAGQLKAIRREFKLDAEAARDALRMAERISAGAGGWAWDAQRIDWHGNEVTLVHAGRVLRIDRLVRHRETAVWWVLDYKSAARPERDPALMAQLLLYREAVQAAYPGAGVRAAFLTGQGELIALE